MHVAWLSLRAARDVAWRDVTSIYLRGMNIVAWLVYGGVVWLSLRGLHYAVWLMLRGPVNVLGCGYGRVARVWRGCPRVAPVTSRDVDIFAWRGYVRMA